jgi:putative aldouronate transport system substrate-binding protein
MERITAFVLGLVLVLGPAAFGGGAGETSKAAAPAVRPILKTIALEAVAVSEKPSVVQAVSDYLNFDWRPTLMTAADWDTKKAALVAAKDLPDVFPINMAEVESFSSAKLIVPLDDLLKKYGTDMEKNRGTLLRKGPNAAGTVWGITTPGQTPLILVVRKDWLNNLGLKVPATIDEFYEVAKAFTFNDPNKNGKKDTFGNGIIMAQQQTYQYIWEPYGMSVLAPAMVDGVVTTNLKHPNFLKAISFLRRLYSEGIMDPDFASLQNMQSYEKLWNGLYGSYCYSIGGLTVNWLGRYTEKPIPEFVYVSLKDGANGRMGITPELPSKSLRVIAASCKRPDVAMTYLNFTATEKGDEMTYLGIEGRHFKWIDKANGKYEYLPPYNVSATHRADGGYAFWLKPFGECIMVRGYNEVSKQGLALAQNNPLKVAYIYGTPAIETSTGSTLYDIEREAIASLIVSKGNIETELQGFIKRWMSSGGETWEKEATAIYRKENP